ncbi:MAG: two-component sensor histidine kinase [Streptosporangiales bacterium]|nr:two-component sensor histidine kinase [Streptosporangiales bacterium]
MVTQSRPGRSLRGRARDAVLLPVLAAICAAPYVLPPRAFDQRHPDKFDPPFEVAQWTVALPILAIGLLLTRRQYPRTTLAAVVGLAVVAVSVNGAVLTMALPVMVALFNLALRTDRKTWLVAAGITAAAVTLPIVIRYPSMWPQVFGIVFWVALPPAIAEAVRNRRAYLAEVVERARRAEETKEQEARRQVAEERIRIARDLHDILAHTIAVINVQSGVAAHVIDGDTEQARQALVHINDASDTALQELRTMLDVLRQDGDQTAPTRPAPTLRDLDELVDGLRASGVAITVQTTGDLDEPATEVGVVAYRVLQEALTNVLKHARASAVQVRATVDGDGVDLEVADDGVGSPDPPPVGHGRMGMRERVHSVGGTVQDGPVAGGYRVTAQLPSTTSRSRR